MAPLKAAPAKASCTKAKAKSSSSNKGFIYKHNTFDVNPIVLYLTTDTVQTRISISSKVLPGKVGDAQIDTKAKINRTLCIGMATSPNKVEMRSPSPSSDL